jgi:hypothetical protein
MYTNGVAYSVSMFTNDVAYSVSMYKRWFLFFPCLRTVWPSVSLSTNGLNDCTVYTKLSLMNYRKLVLQIIHLRQIELYTCRFQADSTLSWAVSLSVVYGKLVKISTWARIFKRLWSPGTDFKEWIPPAYVAWRAGTKTLFLPGA